MATILLRFVRGVKRANETLLCNEQKNGLKLEPVGGRQNSNLRAQFIRVAQWLAGGAARIWNTVADWLFRVNVDFPSRADRLGVNKLRFMLREGNEWRGICERSFRLIDLCFNSRPVSIIHPRRRRRHFFALNKIMSSCRNALKGRLAISHRGTETTRILMRTFTYATVSRLLDARPLEFRALFRIHPQWIFQASRARNRKLQQF